MSRREMTQVSKLIKNQKISKKTRSVQANRNASTIRNMIQRELINPDHDQGALDEM
jgi:hypothetical protein